MTNVEEKQTPPEESAGRKWEKAALRAKDTAGKRDKQREEGGVEKALSLELP